MMVAKKQRPRAQIGPYQILAKIGEGGMGTVYLTKMDGPSGFNKLAVVKELRADLVGSKDFAEMFLNEARLAARLTHPNVVHTYEANDHQGRLYLAMEYLDGQPWSRVRELLWKNGSLPFPLHVRVLIETLAGLHYAHELRDYDGTSLQVVHCDMSPHNVFVTYDGQVKVVDFGVARAVTADRRPEKGILVGKLAYIAPEQAKGKQLDRRADVFAVGVMLWEALAGRRFADSQDLNEMRRRRALGAEPRIREVVPNAPRALAEICDRALALSPADRFATAAEFRDALLASGEPLQDLDQVRLAELVADAFKEDRARVHGIIERNFKSAQSLASSVEDLVAALTPNAGDHTLKADLSELASVSRLRDDVAVIEASGSASIRVERRKRPLILLAGAVAGVLALTIWLLRPNEPTPTAHPLPEVASDKGTTAPATPTPAAVGGAQTAVSTAPAKPATRDTAAPGTVQLSVSAQPAAATILMDGVPLPSNPFISRVHADGELHLLRASAPGMQPQERVIPLDSDRVVSFKLTPPVGASKAVSARGPRRPQKAGTGSQAAAHDDAVVAPSDPAHARPRGADTAFDAPLVPNAGKREIYEEDPYR
jgi:serine/threonine-protein kinase